MPLPRPRSRFRLSTLLWLTLAVACWSFGCSRQPPSWGLTGSAFKQTYIQSLHTPEGAIRIWFDRQEPTFTVRRTGPDMGQINPSPEDLRRGFYGSEELEDGRVLSFRCLTENGEHGTMMFELDGEPFRTKSRSN